MKGERTSATPIELVGEGQWPYGEARDASAAALAMRSIAQAVRRETSTRSMRQIALDAGVTHTVLSKLVAGTTWPDLRTLLALSDTLGVDLIAGATQAQDRSHHETLLRDFCATLGQWSVSRVMVLGYECAILANPAPVLIALPNAGASLSSLHRAMGAVISCAHKADVPGRLLVLETKPPTDVLKLLKTSAISAQWRSAAGGFDGALGRALNPQLLAADT